MRGPFLPIGRLAHAVSEPGAASKSMGDPKILRKRARQFRNRSAWLREMVAMLSSRVDRSLLEGEAMDLDREAMALEIEAAGIAVR